MRMQGRKKEEKMELKLQSQQILAFKIFSSILAFTGKAIFSFLSFKTSTELQL